MEVVFNYEDIIDSLSPNQVKELVQDAKDYVLAKGGLVVTRNSPRKLDHFNFMLFPTPWPRRLYREAKEVQKDFNLLVHKVCNDHDFIKEALSKYVVDIDLLTMFVYVTCCFRDTGIHDYSSIHVVFETRVRVDFHFRFDTYLPLSK